MKRVTVYTVGQAQLEVAGEWVMIRTEMPSLHPITPWNVDPEKEDTAVAMKDEHAEILRVRRVEGGRHEDRYVVISRSLAELLIPALQPVAQKLLEQQIRETNLARRSSEVAHSLRADAEDRAGRTQRRFSEYVERVNRFRDLPWYARVWRTLRGVL